MILFFFLETCGPKQGCYKKDNGQKNFVEDSTARDGREEEAKNYFDEKQEKKNQELEKN
jgi:hypothetical protein